MTALAPAVGERWGGSPITMDPSIPNNIDMILEAAEHNANRRQHRLNQPAYLDRMARFLDLMESAKRDDYAMVALKETMSTSDFPLLFGDILDRQVLGIYQAWPVTWRNYCRVGSFRDFRQKRIMTLDGMSDRWYPDYATPELTSVKINNNLNEGGFLYAPTVYERGYSMNWRMPVNDDTDAFSRLPQEIAQGALRTQEYAVTSLFASTGGPNATFFSVANRNLVSVANGALVANPPLSVAGLQDAITALRSQRDPVTGEPIYVDMVELVVPPDLEVIANNILYATTIRAGGYISGASGGGGTQAQAIDTVNWMRGKVRLSVNPYLPIIDTTSGRTAWYLFGNPDNGNPAMELSFLRGFETPQVLQKVPNMMRVGGAVDPMLGDYDTGSIEQKGMQVFGQTLLRPQSAVASTGTGS